MVENGGSDKVDKLFDNDNDDDDFLYRIKLFPTGNIF